MIPIPPYVKYYLVKNPNWEKLVEPVEKPTVEFWEMMYGYEPTKINPNYDDFCEQYLNRETERRKSAAPKSMVRKIEINSDEDLDIIKQIEELEDFMGWWYDDF